MSTTNKNSKPSLIIGLLLLLSIAANVYQFNNHTTTVVSCESRIDSMLVVRVELERELSSMEMELEKYRGIAGNLDSLLNDANAQIAEQERKIRKLLSKEKDIDKLNKKLNAELAELRKMRENYLERIDQLITENNLLKSQNEALTQSVQSLNEDKKNLQQKVTVASELKAEYVKVASFKKKSSGRYVESAIAKRTNKIEVCFSVMDNAVAQTGDKMAYIVITEPGGKILGGLTKSEFTGTNGETLNSTASYKFTYDGSKQNICMAYENDQRLLAPGSYMVDVYLDGKLVNSSVFNLK
jgi:predicted  nucleic acid-binding Zn-ribbon protein